MITGLKLLDNRNPVSILKPIQRQNFAQFIKVALQHSPSPPMQVESSAVMRPGRFLGRGEIPYNASLSLAYSNNRLPSTFATPQTVKLGLPEVFRMKTKQGFGTVTDDLT